MDPSLYTKGSGEVRSLQRFTPGSYVSQRAERLTQAGIAGVKDISGADVQRLTSAGGIIVVQAALEYVREVTEQTGVIPEVRAIDLAGLAKLARASRMRPSSQILTEALESKRARLYEKIASSAGGLAFEDASSKAPEQS